MSPVEFATTKVLETYALIFTAERAESVRSTVAAFLAKRFADGETDEERLAVSALRFLRCQDSGLAPEDMNL